PVRFVNLLLGAGIIAAPWIFGGSSIAAVLNNLVAGALVMILSTPPGKITYRYGSWDRYIV
ncbi:MAG: SPW repeat protein, partial [Chloroflexi bacterium]|nr:SPW repeat protein [Chloroflexota bacterium]